MTDEQFELVFGLPDFMREYFEAFAKEMALAVHEEIMGDGEEVEDNENVKR